MLVVIIQLYNHIYQKNRECSNLPFLRERGNWGLPWDVRPKLPGLRRTGLFRPPPDDFIDVLAVHANFGWFDFIDAHGRAHVV
jgi:hypothetical protein